MKLTTYSAASVLALAGCVWHGAGLHPQFYALCIYLSNNNLCLMLLLNAAVLAMLWLAKAVQYVFIGPLRVIEVEHLYERGWFAVSETFLAMTIFRDDFTATFILSFTLLLTAKCFHWLAQDRVEMLEQAPQNNRWFHIRLVSLMALLLLFDAAMVAWTVGDFLERGPSIAIMFGFEYMILAANMANASIKYALHVVDARMDGQWEAKSILAFYAEIFFDLVKLLTYMSFFGLVMQHYGLPIHIIRDLYITIKSFITRVRDLIQYRRATANMNHLYPDVTAEDLANSDKTCIICREDMELLDPTQPPPQQNTNGPPQANPKKLPCGHMFHFRCLRSWLERQQSCPTCRRSVLGDDQQQPQPDGQNNNAPNNQPNVDGNRPPNMEGQPAGVQQPQQQQQPEQNNNPTSPTMSQASQPSNTQPQFPRRLPNGIIDYGHVQLIPLFTPNTHNMTTPPMSFHSSSSILAHQPTLSTSPPLAHLGQHMSATGSSPEDLLRRDVVNKIEVMEAVRTDLDQAIMRARHVLMTLDTVGPSQGSVAHDPTATLGSSGEAGPSGST